MKKLLLIIILLLVPSAFAADCQYPTTISKEVQKEVLTYKNSDIILGQALEISDVTKGNRSSFAVKNPNSFEIEAMFTFNVSGARSGEKRYGKKISAFGQQEIVAHCVENKTIGMCGIEQESISYLIRKPQLMYPSIQTVVINESTCAGLDDGAICNENSQCGGGFCVEGRCNRVPICYGGTCACPENKIECADKTRCVAKETKKVGEQSICSDQECETLYIEEGKCAKKPRDVTRDKITEIYEWIKKYTQLFVFAILILSLSWFFFRKGMNEKEQIKAIKKLEKLENEINTKKSKLEGLKKKEKKLGKKLGNVVKLKSEIRSAKEELAQEKESYKRERQKPFTNPQGYKVCINENGYEVFANNTKNLFHIWWYRHHNNMKRIRYGHEIHHKDFNKRNNHIKNLVEISHEKHMQLHRNRYKQN